MLEFVLLYINYLMIMFLIYTESGGSSINICEVNQL